MEKYTITSFPACILLFPVKFGNTISNVKTNLYNVHLDYFFAFILPR